MFRQVTDEPRLFVYDLGTKQYTDLHVAANDPHWLPDGRRLLFAGPQGIGIFETTGGRTREVFTLPSRTTTSSLGFTLSADGRRIAVVAIDEQSDLWMLAPR